MKFTDKSICLTLTIIYERLDSHHFHSRVKYLRLLQTFNFYRERHFLESTRVIYILMIVENESRVQHTIYVEK